MKLFVDADYGINSFKIIAVSEFCSENIEIISAKPDGLLKRLPYFVASDGLTYFSSNATCRYLFNKNGLMIDYQTDTWLEWEALVLQPSISLPLKTLKDDNVPLKNNLAYLDAVFGKQAYLSCKENFGLADIVVWSNIFPVLEANVSDGLALSNLNRWFYSLKSHPSLLNALMKTANQSKNVDLKKKVICPQYHPETSSFFMPVDVPGFILEKLSECHISAKGDSELNEEINVTKEQILAAHNSWSKGLKSLPEPKKHAKPILPIKGEKNVLITSALPYVNNVPHLGNIIGAVLSADVFARYCRLRGYNTLYVCGTDEYGTATETKAIEMGVTPKEICDKYNKLHSQIYDWFNISFDYFGRTTTQEQTKIAQDIFQKLYDRDFLLTETVEQLFCETCQRFLADRFVEGICPFCLYEDARGDQCDKCGKLINAPDLKNPQCKVCKSTPHMRSSKHLFLDLPKLEPSLKKHLDNVTASGHWSNTAKVITYSWLKDGLKPRCITRDLKWGTPVPLEGFTNKVFYVWFDAPIGYLSITANYTSEWEKWWKQPDLVQLYQFMAKDNVPFHGIIFPACQIGTQENYTLINHLVATEYLNYEDVKFSKSRGIGVFGDDAKDTGIPSDIWRFYLLYLRPETQDTFFSWSDLMLKNNSELLNNLGNFINRALSFIQNNFGGIIPNMVLEEKEKILLAQISCELQNYISCMEKTRLRDAIRPMLSISRLGNQYIQSKKPWELIKGAPSQKEVAGTVLGLSANICCLLCTLMEPYMPDTCAALKLQLNTQPRHHVLTNEFVCLLPPGYKIGKAVPLFKKIDQDLINELKVKYAGKQSSEKNSPLVDKPKTDLVQDQASNSIDASEIDKLNTQVTEQGNKVRQLKAEKAAKSDIDKEVAILLDLKKNLALAKGENPEKPQAKSKKKK